MVKCSPAVGAAAEPRHPGIDRLITLSVCQFLFDIGWEGHFTQALKHLQKNTLVMEFHQAVSALGLSHHGGRQRSITKGYLRAGMKLASRSGQAFPNPIALVRQQQQLHSAAGGAVSQQSGGQNAGVVHHKAIAGLQIRENIIKMAMLQRPSWRCSTISREASRRSSGVCAISS